jgi:hypothetical protein
VKKAIALVAMVGVCLLTLSGSGTAAQNQQPVQPPTPGVAPAVPTPQPQPQIPGGQAGGRSTAAILSVVMPGTGEWMNRDFDGPFPVIECCAGYLCPFFWWASVLDAAVGDRSDRVRFDFWTKPTPER